MRELLGEAARRAADYLDSLDRRAVAPTPEAIARLAALDIALPPQPRPPAETLRLLDEIASPATMASAGGRFFGFVIGGALPVTVASNWLATAWDQNAALHAPTPATSVLEATALRWLLDLLQLPADAGGAFVTGATMANFSALAAARNAVLRRAGWDVERDGLFGAPPITVAIGEEAHPTLVKALGMLGLGRQRVLRVPVDGQGRMRAESLPPLQGPAIVCLQAGNINTGAFDPFVPLIQSAHAAGAWVHVDGAFGLWAAASPVLAPLAAGMADADSWATDAHKWLNVPYDSGLAFVRDAGALRSSMSISADYLPKPGEQRNPSDYTPELSRRARGVDVWAALHTLGRGGVAEMLERCCAHARRFARELQAAGYEVLNDVVLNQVLVRVEPPGGADADAFIREVIRRVQADGTCWLGGTTWQGRSAMRISVSNWSTTETDVDRSVEAILRCARAAGS
jgi:glutamate/tyrosine decarboxylase-like PLP-dependent enzyme